MPDIFLSYNREDQATARWFADGFVKEGFDVWWDVTLRSGEAYDEVTENALKTAKAVVVLWSPRSVVSRWVRAEATIADRNKTLIPVMIEACDRPIMFELTHTAELGHWRGSAEDAAWLAFAADVRRYVERESPQQPSPSSSPAPPATGAKPARGGKRGGAASIAVLPFTNRSGLPEDDVFAFGMVEDIIDAMSQGVNVRVIASSATARFRTGALPDLDAMARQLGVRYVLEGNVRRAGEALRVTTQLVDAASGNIVWTQKFDRPLAQLANLQEELVLEVAARLRTQSQRLEIERVLRKPGDLTAWEAVMRSVAAMRHMTGPALMLAIQEAKRAVEIDPDYGLALALSSSTQAVLYNQVFSDNDAEARRIRAQAERAMELEPDNSVVMSIASGALSVTGFPDEGLAAGLRAVKLNPSNEFGHFACAVASTLLNRSEEAMAFFDKERRLAPDHPTMWISYGWRACAHIRAGRWDEGAKAYEQALALTPDNAAPNIGAAVCHCHLGYLDVATRYMSRGRKCEPETPLQTWELRYGRAHAGGPARDDFLGHLRELWALSEAGRSSDEAGTAF